MATGSWTLALALLAVGAPPPGVEPINQRDIKIPIRVDPAQRANIRELILFSSSNQGGTWNQAVVAKPDQATFPFYAPEDGMYWFSVAVVDQRGNQDPADIYKKGPDLKVLVDTLGPQVRGFTAERVGDEVVVRWDIKDENLDAATLKLEFRTPDMPGGIWSPVAAPQAAGGQVSFKPNSTGPVSVRLQVLDVAKNSGSGQAEVAAAQAPALPPPAPPTPPVIPAAGPAAPGAGATAASFTVPPTAAAAVPMMPSPPPPAPPSPPPPAPPAAERGWSPAPAASEVRPASGSPWSSPVPVVASVGSGQQLVAATSDVQASVSHASPAGAPPAGPRPARGQMPDVQLVNNLRVTLEYEVGKYGPSGVGSVELYYTRDDGRTWQPFAGGQQRITMPLPAELRSGAVSPLRRTLTVDLPEQGLYGFYLVVKSGAGLGKAPPQSGDVPQMRIQVDTTPPSAQLFRPEPDAKDPHIILINWNASDPNLGPTPVLLEWAERKGGPWEVIGKTEQPNTGRYAWQVPPNLPPRVFLRLTVRDAANNAGVAETDQPVTIDLVEPEAVFIGLPKTSR